MSALLSPYCKPDTLLVSPKRKVLPSSFYKWETWDLERFRNLPGALLLEVAELGLQPQQYDSKACISSSVSYHLWASLLICIEKHHLVLILLLFLSLPGFQRLPCGFLALCMYNNPSKDKAVLSPFQVFWLFHPVGKTTTSPHRSGLELWNSPVLNL